MAKENWLKCEVLKNERKISIVDAYGYYHDGFVNDKILDEQNNLVKVEILSPNPNDNYVLVLASSFKTMGLITFEVPRDKVIEKEVPD